jgi:hypothetical protein
MAPIIDSLIAKVARARRIASLRPKHVIQVIYRICVYIHGSPSSMPRTPGWSVFQQSLASPKLFNDKG